ncbi:MAG: CDP-diacylglycerol--serine O-phosphatidyltransferase [Deltaproteobacteria bacterium]|nr:MAG: CDP-diacylglycerol--serine O-phosphatidyltransferase [Deltaproteobacteria bacterium]
MNKKPELKYILPNLFTAGSIFVSIISVVYAYNERFIDAGWLIVLSAILDGLDGRVARLTGTQSKFGVEFDSLADIISFGVAPSLLFFFVAGKDYGKIGVFLTAIFIVLGAIRLARFNVTTKDIHPNIFIGLPIPSAALFVVSWIMLANEYELALNLLIGGFIFFAGVLMVSNIRYPSFKKIDFGNQRNLKILVLIVILLGLIYTCSVLSLWLIFNSYVFFGFFRASYLLIKKRKT